jgi:twitching motility protein PilT
MSTSTISLKPVRDICGRVAGQIPESKRGLEYHAAIGDIINELPEEERSALRQALNSFLVYMEKIEASDIDLGGPGCNGRIWYRVFGKKSPLNMDKEIPVRETDVLLHNAITRTQRQELLDKKSLDFSYSIQTDGNRNRRYRANMYMDLESLALNMRKIDTEIRPFKSLGVHPEVAKALSLKYYKYGLTLVTGITGSGKSSTLDTIIDANNRTVDAHIVIIASPVELIHNPIRSVVRHREVGRDVTSFKNGAVQALRQDPISL